MRVKQYLGILLVVMLMVLSACSGNNSSSNSGSSSESAPSSAASSEASGEANGKPVVVKAWFHQYGEKQSLEFLQQWTEEYNQSQNKIKVDLTIVAGGSNDYSNKLNTAFASGEGPDIFELSASDFVKFQGAGIVAPLDDLLTSDLKADIAPNLLAPYTVENKLYAIPFALDAFGLFYDKDVLSKANVEPPKTFDELKAAAKKLTTDNMKGLIMSPNPGGYQNAEFYPFLWNAGSDVLDATNKASVFGGEGTVKALSLYREMMKDGSIPKQLETDSWDIQYLLNGQGAMQLSGVWTTPQIESSGKNIGLVPYPAVEAGGVQTTVLGGWSMMANANSENLDAAKEVVRWLWLDNPQRMADFNTIGTFHLPTRNSAIVLKKDLFEKPLYKEWVEMFKNGRKELSLPPEVATILTDSISNALFNDTAVDQIVKEADEKIKSVLSK